jgi:hypothetical protein
MIVGVLVVVLVIMIVRPVFSSMRMRMFVLVPLVSVLVAVLVKVPMRVDMFVLMGVGHLVMFMLMFMLVRVLVLVLVLVFMFSFHSLVSFRGDQCSVSGFLLENYLMIYQTEQLDLAPDRLLFTEDADQSILIRFFRLNDVYRLHDQLFGPFFYKICIGFTHAKDLLDSFHQDMGFTTPFVSWHYPKKSHEHGA